MFLNYPLYLGTNLLLEFMKKEFNIINFIFKSSWLCIIILIFFFPNKSIFMKIFTIFILLILTFITVFRLLESKKKWNKLVQEMEDQD